MNNTDSFPKQSRLLKRSEFLRVQKQGKKVVGRAFIGLFTETPPGRVKLGIIASKRTGNAVARNRIKRLVREAFRKRIMDLPDKINFVVIAKKNASGLSSSDIFCDLETLGNSVSKIEKVK